MISGAPDRRQLHCIRGATVGTVDRWRACSQLPVGAVCSRVVAIWRSGRKGWYVSPSTGRELLECHARGVHQLASAGEAITRTFGHAAYNHLTHLCFDRIGSEQPWRRFVQVRVHDSRVSLPGVRHLPGQTLVEHGGERIYIPGCRGRMAQDLFGRRIVETSDKPAGRR